MPVYLIFACEVIVFSFLIGAFMNSLVLSVTVLGASGLLMYILFQWLYNTQPLVWGATLLGGITTLLWASYLDTLCGTTFIAILLGLLSGFICYVLNDRFFKIHPA
ncbi:MAG TPA: hypothetical protein VMW10_12805 [Alphaproteobacteria bacterium]|nr:hypothetical protein [Alphaproteobacteria bacterium]